MRTLPGLNLRSRFWAAKWRYEMAAFRRSIAIAALLAAAAHPVFAGTMPPLAERVSRLPNDNFQTWFSVMLISEFGKGPDWQAFFGDVGPTEGCAAQKAIRDRIVRRDLVQFKLAYVAAVEKNMSPEVFADIPDGRLSIAFDSRINSFERALRDFLRPRTAELGQEVREWASSHGYVGRRLGYNSAGIPYWGQQHAMTVLVCMLPNDDGLLRGWK